MTEATNRVSQHIFRKLGFVERVQLSYREYRRGGVPVFASIADHGGPMSMDRQLVRHTQTTTRVMATSFWPRQPDSLASSYGS